MKRCTAKCCARVPAKLHLPARLSLQGCLWQGEAFLLFWHGRERPRSNSIPLRKPDREP